MADLRALFSTNDRSVIAAEVFTNREDQWRTVRDAITGHLTRTADPGFDVEDLETPRRNMVVFHGIGGIGKSTLSRKLEASLTGTEDLPVHWGEPVWPGGRRILPVRIDLARSAGTDFERVILTIRLALAELGPLPAFDIALRRYWEHQHPGASMEEYLQGGGFTSKAGKELPRQVQSVLSDVAQALLLPGTVGSVVGQVTGSLVRALRERRQTVRALAGCTRLADLLEAEPDLDALSYYPHLLAWELERLPADKRVLPVILLDTFEDTGDRTHRDLERLLQRLVWLMPNCFFIVTGRSRLQWAQESLHGQLDWSGPHAWPGLALQPDGGDQILIGDFSPEDCDTYLADRLTRDGQPLIGEDIRAVITDRSHGLPLHLDLSVLRFLELRRTGHTPAAVDFDVAFPALIARTLADLTPEERHVLRSVSLLDSFDLILATRAAGMERQAPVVRLLERPFIRQNAFSLWPYHLHALIRSTIRTADDATDDRWSSQDWKDAAERAFAALGEQWAASTAPGRLLLIGCLRQGLALARDHHLDLGWLTDATWKYISDSVWEPLLPPAPTNPDAESGLQTPADALIETLSALARRQHEHRSRTADRLTAVVDTGLLPAALQEMAVYYRAKSERDLGRTDASRQGMQYVVDGGGRLAPAARRGLAHLARLSGDFPAALAAAETLGWPGRHHRITGDVWWIQGHMGRAAAAYEAARTEAEEHGVVGERATSQAHRALALAFADPHQADDELDLAEQLLTGLDLRATTFITKVAALARDAGTTDPGIGDRITLLRSETAVAGVTAAQVALELADAFHHAVREDHHQVLATLGRLRELTRAGDYAYYADIAAFMSGLPHDTSAAQWIDGEETTRQRWHGLVAARREHLRVDQNLE
ncbi:ATP/GTP-binding protein [Streptomyces lavendulae]|uniref:ATP/GTP-binding protein n=1 Tax=Streptomyces lavendulae TaxID=1914 RepID=UPI003814A1D1